MHGNEQLNPEQRAAVEAADGPCLVLAGAGTGKTRVITHRCAHLVCARGIAPERILAVTFTNKAAGEMGERVGALMGDVLRRPWTSTFHALGARILRADAGRLGRKTDFVIYDDADQVSLMKKILEALDIGEDYFEPRGALSAVGRLKDKLLSPDDARERTETHKDGLLAKIYAEYATCLAAANAMDFDDLIYLTVRLLREHKDVLAHYAERFHYVLVDEFQDTNHAQYELMRLLAYKHRNLCAVGDEDQSIYRWRGADIGNILRFREDYPDATLVKLERNYRSTDVILKAASSVIAKNTQRIGKTVWSDAPARHKIRTYAALSDLSEAAFIADEAASLRGEYPYSEMAVLYRTNAQSRAIEDAFMRRRIPYLVVGGLRFYERKEVKDVLAYLRFLHNPDDAASFARVINVPTRGIGAKTLLRIEDAARRDSSSAWEAAKRLAGQGGDASPREKKALSAFRDMIETLRRDAMPLPLSQLILSVLEATGYYNHLEKEEPARAEERRENLRELVSSAAHFSENEEDGSLAAFLDRAALVSDADNVNVERGVQLMTLHCAKGLEFSAVFLAGMNDGLFPHSRSSESAEEIEEERRLFYVGMTRAKERLYLTSAERRRVFGEEIRCDLSPFLDEVPSECLDAPMRPERAFGDEASQWTEDEDQTAGAAIFDEEEYADDGMEEARSYRAGMRVRHSSYGVGKILMVEPSAQGQKLTVEFLPTRRLKKVLAQFVQPA